MATADQIKALIKSFGEADEERFYSVALQLAAHAAHKGQGRFAQELRDLVDKARGRRAASGQHARPIPVVQPRGELLGLLTASYPQVRLADMALDEATAARLRGVLLEQRESERLRAHGLPPARRLLLTGAPGTGKTMTASAMAAELSENVR